MAQYNLTDPTANNREGFPNQNPTRNHVIARADHLAPLEQALYQLYARKSLPIPGGAFTVFGLNKSGTVTIRPIIRRPPYALSLVADLLYSTTSPDDILTVTVTTPEGSETEAVNGTDGLGISNQAALSVVAPLGDGLPSDYDFNSLQECEVEIDFTPASGSNNLEIRTISYRYVMAGLGSVITI